MKFGPYEVEISNRDKLFFPDAGLSKGDLIDYYLEIADTLIPHMKRYGVSMQRFPDGIDGDGFFQKDVSDHFPGWLKTVKVPKREGGSFRAPVVTNKAALAYLVDQAVLTPHLYLARVDDLEHPDRMIFDIDPPDQNTAPGTIGKAAQDLRTVLKELDLPAWLQTTGSKGLHVVVPLDRSADFDEVRHFAQDVARLLVRRHPEAYTVAQRKQKRQGRIFLDTQRNSYGATAVSPYAVRALPGAPVATPVHWEEAEEGVSPRQWTLETLPNRLAQTGDPWNGLMNHARGLSDREQALREMLAEEEPVDREES